jgi:histone-lysine N-methyltransferase SETMAR
MANFEHRAVIKYLLKKGMSFTEIYDDMLNTLGEGCPSYTTIRKWGNEFKRGRISLEDDPRSGRPKTATTPEMVDKVHDLMLNDRRLKASEIAEAVGISKERVLYILHEELDMRKLSARWVPRLLTMEQKRVRSQMSINNLEFFKRNTRDFLRRFVTCDETWVHYYTPESKQQSKMWTKRGEPAPKKAKTVLSAGKVMASVFWDAKGILFIDYLQKGKTIKGEYYANLLNRLKTAIAEKRPGMNKKKVLFHQDNAPVHSCTVAAQKIKELGFELVPHPPYSPDLAPSDFHLFPKLKIFLGGKKFCTNEALISTVNDYFEGLDENHFRDGIKKLEHRWTKCMDLEGDYVEK